MSLVKGNPNPLAFARTVVTRKRAAQRSSRVPVTRPPATTSPATMPTRLNTVWSSVYVAMLMPRIMGLMYRGRVHAPAVSGRLTHPIVPWRRCLTSDGPMLLIATSTLVGIAGFAGLLQLIPRLGAAGTRIAAWLCRAPGLDLVVSLFTWIPPTVLGIVFGWRGVAGGGLGRGLGVLGWTFAPELAHHPKLAGARRRPLLHP